MPYIGRYGWNTFKLDGPYSDPELVEAIDNSYVDVHNRLPKGKRPSVESDA
jgi:predicted DNA-binding protein (MmcQ/YjbR family)